MTESLHEDERYLQQEAKLMVQQVVNFSSNKDIASFYINDFSSYPTALQRRAYHLILNYLYFHLPKNLSYVHEQDFFELLNSTMGNVEIDFPRHLKLKRSYQKVMFYFTNKHHVSSPYHFILDIPEKVSLPNGSQISAVHTDKREREDRFTYICALDDVELPLHIRTRQPGDRMSWKGLNGSKKIKDIFIDAKIPKDERDAWPIVTDNHGQILWLVGLKKGFSEAKGTSDMYIQLNYKTQGFGRDNLVDQDIEKTLITEEEIQQQCKKIGKQLAEEYEEKFPLAIGVLKGAMPFMSDLLRYMNIHLEMDFMDVSSYGGKKRQLLQVR